MTKIESLTTTVEPDHEWHDVVAAMNLKEWTEQFWAWAFQTRDEANPITAVGPARSWRYVGGQPTSFQKQCMKDYGEATWFIAPAPYAEPGSVIVINIPSGKWSFLIAPAIACASTEAYPSLNSLRKLRDHVWNDISKTYELWTILDGFSLKYHFIDNTRELVEIDNVPVERSKNMINTDLIKTGGKIKTVQCGYWNWLKPLSPGDHLLHIHSMSPIYRVDVTYQLSIAGPEPNVDEE